MLPGKQYSSDDIFRILSGSKWIILIPFAIGLAAAPLIAGRVPELYRSETLITVERQQIPESYVKVVTAPVAERLPAIREQILSRSRLERIIRDLNLYQKERATEAMEDVVRRMRTAVDVKLDNKESFRVSYESADPQTAQAVAQRLASLSIEENFKQQERVNEGTNQFLESELEDARQRLKTSEQALEAYRRQHAGQLPTQLSTNLQSIQNAQMQLQAINELMNRTRERKILYERQLADAQTEVSIAAPVSNTSGGSAPVLTTAQQLEAAKARRELFQGHYTADHPDMKALERSIRDLESKLAQEARLPVSVAPKLLTATEAARQKRIVDLKAELEVIDHQLNASQGEASRLQNTIGDLQGKVATLPTRESELTELTRDYNTLQSTYNSLRTKQEDAKLAANLQRRQIGEQFTTLDAASLPERPFNRSSRMVIMFSGAIIGLVLGVGFVAVREIRDTSIKSEDDLVRTLSLPVLALIPLMASEGERRHQKRRALLVNIAGTAVLLGSMAALVIWRLQS